MGILDPKSNLKLHQLHILYNYEYFVCHTSQGVPDMSKFVCCHASQKATTKGSCVTYVQIWKFSVRPLVRWHIFDLVTAHFGGWQIENFARCVMVTHGWRNIHNCTVYEYIGWFQGEEAELWWGAKQLWGRRIKIALGSLLDIYSALKCVDDWPNDDQMVLRVNCITK